MASFSQWQQRDYPQSGAPMRAAEVGGPSPFYRDDLDRMRMFDRRRSQEPEVQGGDDYEYVV